MISILLIFLTAIIYPGIIIRTKSIASGRKGPGIFQPIKDIYVLFHKGSVFSTTTSIIFQIAPAITLATILTALCMLPFGTESAIINFDNDFVMFSYLLALGKFFSIISALDTGSGFEGMGANREALYSLLIEPAFFILIATFAAITGYTSFTEIFAHLKIGDDQYMIIIAIISFYILLQIAMIENSRLPIDDPKTHLELTMVHEVMILDNSGFDKALIHIGTMLKFAIYGSLIFNSIIPADWSILLQIGIYLALQVVIAVIMGCLESFRARNKMHRNAIYIFTLSAIGVLAFFLVLVMNHKL
jgi:formate hydrogenlyase subunit 4